MGEKKAEVPVGKELVRMTGIMKEFPGVKALDNVKLDLYAGEVLALLGENGAGKSRLMKILSGVYQRDDGEIILFEAAARELKRLDAVPLPATQRLRAEMDELTARKAALQSEYRKAQREEREYDTLRQNVEALLEKPRETEPQRQRSNELE